MNKMKQETIPVLGDCNHSAAAGSSNGQAAYSARLRANRAKEVLA